MKIKTLRDLRALRGEKNVHHEVHEETRRKEKDDMEFDELSSRVIGCAIEVHKTLGPGLLESTYQECLAYELKVNNISFELEKELPIMYKNIKIPCGYRLDAIIEGKLILELKSVSTILPIHEAQILTYMKLSNVSIGLLINFNVKKLKEGIKRFVL